MTPERYQRLKELFHSALERTAEERAAFLAESCGDDTALRAKVEALIAADEQPGNFMEVPAYAVASETLTKDSAGELVGQSIGRYQVMALLGSGGMGDVYLARDTRLGRKVALKLLPEYLTDDESRIRRFKQEARAASALNHPNVLTIYEIEQADGRYFITTEFVEGETLRQRLKGGGLPTGEALEVVTQIADAISKAHQAGIVHRDLKPENIMLDAEGRVKVLDFGLATYTRPPGGGAADDAESVHTVPGMLMGTTAYMSPEQARGVAVDARTDVWSLGVVLYEMLAGRAPFAGQTPSDVLAAILEHEPKPLAGEGSRVPGELRRIVGKALQKDREKRYQTSKDLALDLQSLRRGLTAEADSGKGGRFETDAREFPAASARAGRKKSAAVLVSGVVLLLAAAVIVGMWARRPLNRVTVGTTALPPAVAPECSLVYSVLVQKYRNGRPYEAPFRLGGEINFEKDYRVRLSLSSPQDGHLYILNEGPADNGGPSPYVILFPSPTSNGGQSRLGAGRQVQVPERSWLQFDAERGTEKVWLVWAAESVPALEALKAYSNPRDRGLVGDHGLNEAARDFLLTHQTPRPTVSRDEEKKESVLTANGAILAHLLRLEHH